jgi:egghead protein (zeste-white 4 protein)
MNTLSDSTRISHDIGSTRFALRYLNKAIMNFKGSFFVCEHGVEKSVTFDHGLEGSITEDAFFAIKASNYGYSFDWIEGEIYEQSPFTFMDIVRQRRRWYQGSYYIGVSNNLKRDLSGMCYRYNNYYYFFVFIITFN